MKILGIISLIICIAAILLFVFLRIETRDLLSGDSFVNRYWYMPAIIAVSALGAITGLTYKNE
jgi:hypothetical protein